jgi:hypothetical protein
MLHRLVVSLVGGLSLLSAPAAFAAPANVTLRVEGTAQTVLPRTALRTDTRTVNKDGVAGHDCPGTTVAGALEIGVGGDWGGTWFDGLGYAVERVRTERHVFPEPDFFEVRVNNRTLPVGVCGAELQEGDDVLLFVARCVFDPATSACSNPPVLPLGLRVPATVAAGAPFDVSVVEFASDGTPSPVAGATIEGGDAPVTTNTAGVAAVTVASGGARALRASKPGRARSALESVCATSGADGLCGTAVPAAAAPGAAGTACRTTGRDGLCGTIDRTAPAARIEGIADGRRFARGRGPRVLRVRVAPDPSGLLAVKLRLTRNDRGRCTYFSGRSERFRLNRSARCGATNGFPFGVGDRETTSYLLPRRLPRGRYVLDVIAIDKALNRDDARRRGLNRVVFHVR